MAILLYCIGIAAVLAGGGAIGFGIPVSEFSFGNTLIAAGATAAVGGLIVIGLGAVVAKLQRIVEGLPAEGAVHPDRAIERYPVPPAEAPGHIPFPPKPAVREPHPAGARVAVPPPAPDEQRAAQSFAPTFAPTLPNPDVPPVTLEDDVSLSPREPTALSPFPPRVGERPPGRDNGSLFDTMWPPAARIPQAAKPGEPERGPESDRTTSEYEGAEGPSAEPALPPSGAEPAKVAVLKSGVVDGMAYTLYVDGSIEAELPQGTLRFASIDDLRSYLEKNA